MLKKKKKVSFPGCPFNKNKRPRLHSPKCDVQTEEDTEEKHVEMKTSKGRLSQKTIDLLAEAAESAFDADSPKTLPPDPPINPPEPLSDQITKVKDGVGGPHDKW